MKNANKMKVFLDANILVDVFAKREPHYHAAQEVLLLAEAGHIEAYTNPLVLANTAYVLNAHYKVGNQKVKQLFTTLTSFVSICNFQGSSAEKALKDEAFTDFEDALHAFNAADEAMDYIITRNEKDFMHSEVKALSPQAFLALVKY